MTLLAGFRLVELSAFVAAPLGGTTLAELGADVVRIDPPGGPADHGRWPLHQGKSLYWAGLNRGKRSVAIDVRSERGRALVTDLISAAGACLTNLPLGSWASHAELSVKRPDLIMVQLTGGPDGSAAVDYTVNAAVGFPWVTGPESWDGPVGHVLPAWDVGAGYLAALALVSADRHRLRTGEGQLVRLSLFDVAASVASHLGLLAEAQLTEEPRRRYGDHVYGTFGRDFRTKDGRHLIVIALTPRQWEDLVQATGLATGVEALERRHDADLTREGDRFRYREEICALLEPWFTARDFTDVAAALNARHVLWGPYQTFKELVSRDSRWTANPMVAALDQPGIGQHLAAASPLLFSRAERLPPRPAPQHGEHTADVLRSWLGLAGPEVAQLERDGIIRTLDPGSGRV